MASAKELRELTLDDLNRRAVDLRETLFRDSMKLKTGTLDSPAERLTHRRELARVLTILAEKSKNGAQAPAPAAAAKPPPVAEPTPEAPAKAAKAPKAKAAKAEKEPKEPKAKKAPAKKTSKAEKPA
jgi:large subunit ribosomal protein L29